MTSTGTLRTKCRVCFLSFRLIYVRRTYLFIWRVIPTECLADYQLVSQSVFAWHRRQCTSGTKGRMSSQLWHVSDMRHGAINETWHQIEDWVCKLIYCIIVRFEEAQQRIIQHDFHDSEKKPMKLWIQSNNCNRKNTIFNSIYFIEPSKLLSLRGQIDKWNEQSDCWKFHAIEAAFILHFSLISNSNFFR